MKKSIIVLALLISVLSVFLFSCQKKEHEHSFEYITVQSTCTSIGYTEARCSCGEVKHTDFEAYASHKEGDWEKNSDASCKSDEEYVQRCINCESIVYRKITKSKLEHTPGSWVIVKSSTCNEAGKREKRCTVCNDVLETEYTDLSDHKYEITYETNKNIRYEVFTCKICGDEYRNQADKDITPNDIYNKITDATVQIYAIDKNGYTYSLGSGFFISPNGEIVTNYHVICGAYKLKVVTKNNKTYSVDKIFGYDKSNDIAILNINVISSPYLEISKSDIKTGDPVYTLGSPLGLADTFSSGIISNPSKRINGKECIQFTSPISTGNSGGPLVNKDGKVIGINTMTTVDGQNINFAIKSSLIEKINKQKPVKPSDLYNETLSENALAIIKNYICVNASSVDLETYVFVGKEGPESEYGYGTEPYLIYDAERDLFSMTVYLVSENKYRFAIEMVIYDLKNEYYISLFDYNKNQIMVTSTVKTGVELGDYDTCFDKAFSIIRNRYDPNVKITDANGNVYTEQEAAQLVLYQSYQTLVEEFAKILENSQTGLTLEHFGLVMPQR